MNTPQSVQEQAKQIEDNFVYQELKKTKQRAAERRAAEMLAFKERQQREEAEFQANKFQRILKVLALSARYQVFDIEITLNDEDREMLTYVEYGSRHNVLVPELEAYRLDGIESSIASAIEEKREAERLLMVKRDVLSRLTEDERKSLGY